MYGSETWRMNETDISRLNVFQRQCLRKIFQIWWPETISNNNLYARAKTVPVCDIIKNRKWRWIGHILRSERQVDAKAALTWTPEGKRKRGRPRTTWRRHTEEERRSFGWSSWSEAKVVACDRTKWRQLISPHTSTAGVTRDK